MCDSEIENMMNEESDEDVIESMKLLDGDYEVFKEWVPPAPTFWDAPPKAIIKSAEVR